MDAIFNKTKNIIALLPLVLAGCFWTESYESKEILSYKNKSNTVRMDQVRFISDDMGSFTLTGLLNSNLMPIKVYGTALLIDNQMKYGTAIDGSRLPQIMKKYGFLSPEKIENWRRDWAPHPQTNRTSLGLIHSDIEQKLPKHTYKIEVANITCAACHSGMTYDQYGRPTGRAWLGSPNTSLDLDGFFDSIYFGLKSGVKNQNAFMKKIKQAYPKMDAVEEATIRFTLLPIISYTLKKYEKMNRVLPFPNGGPGTTNGIGAFKRNAKLIKNPFAFNPHEAGFVSIPDISYRGFRSSLLYDGVYVNKGQQRFREITAAEAVNPKHLNQLSQLITFFTFSAMGSLLKNIEANMSHTQEIVGFLKELTPPPFPGDLDFTKVKSGAKIYAENCSKCHGVYNFDGMNRPQLVSFPNKLVPQKQMQTDPMRWVTVDHSVKTFADRSIFGKYSNPGFSMGGYVAPILSGVWATAPYLHNGSVPTLWHLMHPMERPQKFIVGGHALDYNKVGILGTQRHDNVYSYPSHYKSWSKASTYDTRRLGHSNRGHESEFLNLSEQDKDSLIEYLKLL